MAAGKTATAEKRDDPAVRLLAIPFLVFLALLLEIFLLAGNNRLMLHPDPAGIVVYTTVGCILTGIIAPFLCIRKAFITGAVNMFQIGFRTVRRTILACSLTGAAGFCAILLFNPFGQDRVAFAAAFLLVLPTAIASVMVCWVLAGTHVQAFVRAGGAGVSIATGVVITGLLYAVTTIALTPSLRQEGSLFWPVITGIGAALFFFAVRDVWATILLVAETGVITGSYPFDPALLHAVRPALFIPSLLSVAVLALVHLHLSRNYATLLVPAGQEPAGKAR